MAIFWQYWYWYPLLPFITLSFKPTMIMCLNEDLEMPKLTFKSNTISSMFTYPEYLKSETKKEKKQLTKAVLSITAKEKARKIKKQKTMDDKKETSNNADNNNESKDKMNVDDDINNLSQNINDQPLTSSGSAIIPAKEELNDGSNNKDVQMKEKEIAKQEESNKKLAKEEFLENPSRVTPNQIKYIEWVDNRYKPVKSMQRLFGVIIVKDTKPSEQKDIVEAKTLDASGVHGNEPKPPKPFTYLGD